MKNLPMVVCYLPAVGQTNKLLIASLRGRATIGRQLSYLSTKSANQVNSASTSLCGYEPCGSGKTDNMDVCIPS